jgi:hypothetical protein
MSATSSTVAAPAATASRIRRSFTAKQWQTINSAPVVSVSGNVRDLEAVITRGDHEEGT